MYVVITSTYIRKIPASLIDEDGKFVVEVSEKLQTQSTLYIRNFYPILRSEVDHVIELAKPRRAVDPEKIPNEIIQLSDNENRSKITKLFNEIYLTGIIPTEWQ